MHDAIIVGGGISGLACAEQLAHLGYKTAILEKQASFGGSFPENLQGFFQHDIESLPIDIPKSQPVLSIHLWGPQGARFDFHFKTPLLYIVRRGTADASIDSHLYQRAISAGTQVEFGKEVVKISTGDISEILTRDGSSFRSRYVVAADGVFSRTRTALGLHPIGIKGVGRIAKMADVPISPSEIDGIFDLTIAPQGYGYIVGYPDESAATVGLTVRPHFANEALREYFDRMRSGVKILEGRRVISEFTGFVACGDGEQVISRDNVIFIGEAGGFQDPLFGFGMTICIKSALGAAKAVEIAEDTETRIGANYNSAVEPLIKRTSSRNWRFREQTIERANDADMLAMLKSLSREGDAIDEVLNGNFQVLVKPFVRALISRPQLIRFLPQVIRFMF